MTDPTKRPDRLHIVVVGGGIGGLALAAGLRRHDIDVIVLERDTDLAATGGYHITLDDRAQLALRRLVAPSIMERLLASASALRLRDPDAFFDRRGRLVGSGPDLSAHSGVDVDRITLRLLLAEAVGDSLRTGCTVAGASRTERGADVTLDDGSVISADLVVAADGAHSRIARALAGAPTNRPAGVIGFSGRTSVPALSAAECDRLGRRSSTAVGPHGSALYVGFLDPDRFAVLDAPELRSSMTTAATYIWGAMFAECDETLALRDLTGPVLRDALVGRFRREGWAASSLEVITRTDPASLGAFRFNAASTRARDLAPWPAGAITALGDAVHATPPTAGMGAGAAIRDADALVEQLIMVREGEVALRVAISAFEAAMRQRGAEILSVAMRAVRWILATDTTLGAVATGAVMPALAATQRLRRGRAAHADPTR